MPKKLKKRKDGRYGDYIVIGKKPDGSDDRRWAYAYTLAELELKIANLRVQYNQGTLVKTPEMTFYIWAEQWFNINIMPLEYNTRRNNRNYLNHAYKYLKNLKLKDIRKIDIENMRTQMLEAGLKDTTKRTLALVKRILEDARINHLVFENCAETVKVKRFKREERRPLSMLEDDILITVSKTHKHGLFFLLLRYSGLRIEEIVPLQINDILIEERMINVTKAVSFEPNNPHIKDTKNLKSRKVPILDIVYNALILKLQEKKEDNSTFLFTKQTNSSEMLSKSAIKRMLQSFLLECNKELERRKKIEEASYELKEDDKIYFTSHVLRHSFCTMLYYARS